MSKLAVNKSFSRTMQTGRRHPHPTQTL